MIKQNYHQQKKQLNQRAIFLMLILSLLSLVLIIRLAYLQIKQHHRYTTLSAKNQQRLIPIAPNRGLIYDRNKRLIADNRPAFSLEIIPDHVNNIDNTITYKGLLLYCLMI